MSRVLNLLVTHQSPGGNRADARVVARPLSAGRTRWSSSTVSETGLPAKIAHPHKDPRRGPASANPAALSANARATRRSCREASRWLAGTGFHPRPLSRSTTRSRSCRGSTRSRSPGWRRNSADVLTFELARVDGTNQPHYLYHAGLPGFRGVVAAGSACGETRATVLSMFGSGSFWTRAAFDAVAGAGGAVSDLSWSCGCPRWRTTWATGCGTGGNRGGLSAAWAIFPLRIRRGAAARGRGRSTR